MTKTLIALCLLGIVSACTESVSQEDRELLSRISKEIGGTDLVRDQKNIDIGDTYKDGCSAMVNDYVYRNESGEKKLDTTLCDKARDIYRDIGK